MRPASFRWSDPEEDRQRHRANSSADFELHGCRLEVASLRDQLALAEASQRETQRELCSERGACAELSLEKRQLHLESEELRESVSVVHEAVRRGGRALKAAAAATGVTLTPVPQSFVQAGMAASWVEEALAAAASQLMEKRRSPSRRHKGGLSPRAMAGSVCAASARRGDTSGPERQRSRGRPRSQDPVVQAASVNTAATTPRRSPRTGRNVGAGAVVASTPQPLERPRSLHAARLRAWGDGLLGKDGDCSGGDGAASLSAASFGQELAAGDCGAEHPQSTNARLAVAGCDGSSAAALATLEAANAEQMVQCSVQLEAEMHRAFARQRAMMSSELEAESAAMHAACRFAEERQYSCEALLMSAKRAAANSDLELHEMRQSLRACHMQCEDRLAEAASQARFREVTAVADVEARMRAELSVEREAALKLRLQQAQFAHAFPSGRKTTREQVV